jgi:hypothetical protein
MSSSVEPPILPRYQHSDSSNVGKHPINTQASISTEIHHNFLFHFVFLPVAFFLSLLFSTLLFPRLFFLICFFLHLLALCSPNHFQSTFGSSSSQNDMQC